jgi:hypothetical protein
MWNYIPSNLLGIQRQAALHAMGHEARQLLRDGYAVEADRVLDEMAERRAEWGLEGGG